MDSRGLGPEVFKPEKVHFDNPLKRSGKAYKAANM